MEIVIKNLSKVYGDKKALNDVSMRLNPGIYGLLGPNGAGKSTLINLLTDGIERTQGQILVDGTDILKQGRDYRRRFGYMPQQQNMYNDYTGVEFLQYMAAVKGIPGRKAYDQIQELLKIVNLWDKRYKKIGGYSGGMKQRIMLAQALLGEPELLILDEPTAGLDPQERINIRNHIAELSEKMIVLFATHVVSDIECIAKEVILLKDGSVVKKASPIKLISEIVGKVGILSCDYQEIGLIQQKYCTGNVQQTVQGLQIKIISDELPGEARISQESIGLEEVYLYYNEYLEHWKEEL